MPLGFLPASCTQQALGCQLERASGSWPGADEEYSPSLRMFLAPPTVSSAEQISGAPDSQRLLPTES